MSYIAFELDAFNQVPLVATVTGLKPSDITHGLMTMWVYVFRSSVDRVTDLHIDAFFGAKKIAPVLATFGFLEADGDGWRVKGGDRYKRVREMRSKAGKLGRAAQINTARANAGQNPDKGRSKCVLPGQTPGKTGHEPGQNRTGDRAKVGTYTEGVPLKGNTPSEADPVEGTPPSAPLKARSGAHAAPTNGKRTKLTPGTPEWDDAVKREDWTALGWSA